MRATLLIVEDEFSLRRLIRLIMPEMNGQEFIAEVRARQWNLSAIFVSASPEAHEVCPTGHGMLRKPYDFHVLLGAIDTLLAERVV